MAAIDALAAIEAVRLPKATLDVLAAFEADQPPRAALDAIEAQSTSSAPPNSRLSKLWMTCLVPPTKRM